MLSALYRLAKMWGLDAGEETVLDLVLIVRDNSESNSHEELMGSLPDPDEIPR